MPKSEQGVFSERYKVIPRVLIFLTNAERVLLIKGAPDKRLWANKYNGIGGGGGGGGHIERGEDVLSAARRELFEETGLLKVDLQFCGSIMIDVERDMGITLYVFSGSSQNTDVIPSDEGGLEWVPIDTLENYDLVEDLRTLLPKIFTQENYSCPFFARYYYDENENLQIGFAE